MTSLPRSPAKGIGLSQVSAQWPKYVWARHPRIARSPLEVNPDNHLSTVLMGSHQALDLGEQLQQIKGFTDAASRTNFIRPLLCVDGSAHHDDGKPAASFAEFACKPPAIKDRHAHIDQRQRHPS